MSDLELKSVYSGNYEHVLKMLEVYRYKHPECYHILAGFADEFRGYVRRVAHIDDLPPVPKP